MSEPTTEPSGPEITRALRLRGDPPDVMRLSRRTLAVLGGVTAIAVAGALTFALRPAHDRSRNAGPTGSTENRRPTELITGGPKDYSEVPKLGPPLPGDLGRPIVSAQARGVDVTPPTIGIERVGAAPPAQAGPPAASKAQIERDAARTSGLLVGLGGRATSASASINADPVLASPPPPMEPPPTGSQAAKRAFLAQAGATPTTAAARLLPPASPYLLQAGSVIPAALITGIRSDLPGQVTAQVTQEVYDSPTGRLLLVPQGARLIGTYDSEIGFGQSRVLLAWTRLILPDGRSIALDGEPGADPQGFAGVEDRIDQHWGQLARATALSSLLGMSAELGSDGDDAVVRALRQGAQDTINQTGRQLVRRRLDVQPTLTIRPGHPVRVVVTRDLVLAPIDREQ